MLKTLFLFFIAVVILSAWQGLSRYQVEQRETKYDADIKPIATAEGLDPALIRAVIWKESRFDPRVYGLAKERGLMQVTPQVADDWQRVNKVRDFQLDDLFKARTNITVGCWILARAIHHWKDTDDPVVFGLAEYNAGRTNALRWVDPTDPASAMKFLTRVDYASTRIYVQTIMEKRDQYRDGHFASSLEQFWVKTRRYFERLVSE